MLGYFDPKLVVWWSVDDYFWYDAVPSPLIIITVAFQASQVRSYHHPMQPYFASAPGDESGVARLPSYLVGLIDGLPPAWPDLGLRVDGASPAMAVIEGVFMRLALD